MSRRALTTSALFALCVILGSCVAPRVRAESESAAERIVPPTLLATGVGLMVSAMALESALLASAASEDVGPRYRRMQHAVGPLSGIGLAVNLANVPVGLKEEWLSLPVEAELAVLLVGLAGMVTGIVLAAHGSPRIGDTSYREPFKEGGTLLICGGIPLSLWAGTRMLVEAYARVYAH